MHFLTASYCAQTTRALVRSRPELNSCRRASRSQTLHPALSAPLHSVPLKVRRWGMGLSSVWRIRSAILPLVTAHRPDPNRQA